MSEIKQLLVDDLRIDGDTQSRVELDTAAVLEYAEHYNSGTTLPALVVFYDGIAYWLADGFHRYHASRNSRAMEVPCEVHLGTVDDARLYAAGANQVHGVRRTGADKRRAIAVALGVKPDWSDRAIAAHCGVSDKTIATVRDELRKSEVEQPAPRIGLDGKTRAAKKITPSASRNKVVEVPVVEAVDIHQDPVVAGIVEQPVAAPQKPLTKGQQKALEKEKRQRERELIDWGRDVAEQFSGAVWKLWATPEDRARLLEVLRKVEVEVYGDEYLKSEDVAQWYAEASRLTSKPIISAEGCK